MSFKQETSALDMHVIEGQLGVKPLEYFYKVINNTSDVYQKSQKHKNSNDCGNRSRKEGWWEKITLFY